MAQDPGDGFATARPFQVTRRNKSIRESLSGTDLFDVWSFNLKKRSKLNVTIDGLARGSNIALYLADLDRTIEFSNQPRNRSEQLSEILLDKGTYYIGVELQTGSKDTSYKLNTSATPSNDKFGNSIGTAAPIESLRGFKSIISPTNLIARDAVSESDPIDVFKFSVPVAGNLKVELTGLSNDATLDLYNNKVKLVKRSANPDTENERIDRAVNGLVGLTYYIVVSRGATGSSNYTLRYSFTPDTPKTTPSGLKYIDLKPGTGATPQTGQTVAVQYDGVLEDGTTFDSSRTNNQPFSFVIGTGQVIKGWDEGISTMKVGSRRQLIIPAELAYGSTGTELIPPNATLIFDVEVVSIT